MNEVTEFTCCRAFVVPVAGSNAERNMKISLLPVPAGSNHGSPEGTLTWKASVCAPAASPMSWSRNWPNSYSAVESPRASCVTASPWSETALLIARALGRSAPAGADLPSA